MLLKMQKLLLDLSYAQMFFFFFFGASIFVLLVAISRK